MASPSSFSPALPIPALEHSLHVDANRPTGGERRLPEKDQEDSAVGAASDSKPAFKPGGWLQVAASFVAWMNTVYVHRLRLVVPNAS
jgi:hypothetical protein